MSRNVNIILTVALGGVAISTFLGLAAFVIIGACR